jgi:hypothetical protein
VQFPEFIDTNKLKAIFAKLKDPKTEFTIFVVRGIGNYRSPVNGRTIPDFGYALVSDIRSRTTMAHEVGHFLGGHPEKDGWKDLPDLEAPTEMLMRDGGAGWKIPLNLTMKFFRPFFDRKEKQQSKRGAAH